MRAYARIQKICFYGGLVGLAVMLVVLLFSSNADFVSAYNQGPRTSSALGATPTSRPSRPVASSAGPVKAASVRRCS